MFRSSLGMGFLWYSDQKGIRFETEMFIKQIVYSDLNPLELGTDLQHHLIAHSLYIAVMVRIMPVNRTSVSLHTRI